MKDQPWDFNRTWPVGRKWCRFTNASQKISEALPQNLRLKEHQILDHFSATSALDNAYLRKETSYRQTKMLMAICNVTHDSWPTSVTFEPETAEIRWRIVTHPMKFSIFCHYRANHIGLNATEPRPTKFCQMLEGLRGLLSTVKNLG